jgi:hypothetical protein
MPSTANTILIAEISQYLSLIDIENQKVFNINLNADSRLPALLYAVRKNVEFAYDASIYTRRAVGTIAISGTVGGAGDVITVTVDDPILGEVTIGTYTLVSGDTTNILTATHLAAAITGSGYTASSRGVYVDILAPTGRGDLLNGVSVSVDYASGFVPTEIANLWAWYDAAQLVTGTTAVTLWGDSGGNALRALSTLFSPELETNAVNGLPAIRKPASSNALLTGSVAFPDNASTGMTIFMVASQDTESANGIFLSVGTSLDVAVFRTGSSNSYSAKMRSGGSIVQGTTMTNGTFYSMRISYEAGTQYVALNNGTESFNSVTVGSMGSEQLFLFGSPSGTFYGNKKIAEIIIYTRKLSGAEVTQVETYLNDKYNLY